MISKVLSTLSEPMKKFVQMEAFSGIFLFFSAVVAMGLANSEALSGFYFSVLKTPITFYIGSLGFEKNILLLINDGLMVIFFYLVGLEIKREVMVGELASPEKASFSFFAAMGGMVVPALIFAWLNFGSDTIDGWGIPMATDIAFALGVLSLFGKMVPSALKVFLLALAIVDDLGAIMVIALFYTGEIATGYLGVAAAGLITLALLHLSGIRHIVWGIVIGTVVWFCFLKSGVHATIAGVALALLTPAWTKATGEEKKFLLDHYIHALHPWVAFIIMPVFALANAGVNLGSVGLSDVFQSSLGLGIIFGLVVGKPIGVLLFTFVATRLKVARLPDGSSWGQIGAVGFIAGIGFTMSLFISSLAFREGEVGEISKLAIIVASLIAMALGSKLLWIFRDKNAKASE